METQIEEVATQTVTEPACPPVPLYSWWLWRKAPGHSVAFTIVHRDRHVETNAVTHVWVLEMGSSSPVRYSLEKFWQGIEDKKLWEPQNGETPVFHA